MSLPVDPLSRTNEPGESNSQEMIVIEEEASANTINFNQDHAHSPNHQFLSASVAWKDPAQSNSMVDDWSECVTESMLEDDEYSVAVAVGGDFDDHLMVNMESLKRERNRRLSNVGRQDEVSQETNSQQQAVPVQMEGEHVDACGMLLSEGKQLLRHVAERKVECCSPCCCCLPYRYRDLKLSLISVLSIVALIMNVLALLAIASVTITQYLYGSQVKIVDLMTNRASAIASYADMKMSTRLAAFNKGVVRGTYPMQLYKKKKVTFIQSVTDLFAALPPINRPSYQYLNGSSNPDDIPTLEILTYWETTLNITFNGTNVTLSGNTSYRNRTNVVINDTNLLAAQQFINSSNFIQAEKTDEFYFNDFLNSLLDLSLFSASTSKYSNVTSLILLGLSLVIVIPMVLLIFGISLKASSSNQKKLTKVSAVMVLDTMREPASRRLFQTYCLSDPELCDCFDFLECVIRYKELGQDSIEKQVDLFEKSRELITMHEKTKVIDCDPKHLKSILKTERKLKKIEQAKQDMAFDVWSKYLDEFCDNRTIITRVSTSCLDDTIKEIDSFNNKKGYYETFDLLPDDLFDEAERQVAQSISDSHSSFLKSKEPITI